MSATVVTSSPFERRACHALQRYGKVEDILRELKDLPVTVTHYPGLKQIIVDVLEDTPQEFLAAWIMALIVEGYWELGYTLVDGELSTRDDHRRLKFEVTATFTMRRNLE